MGEERHPTTYFLIPPHIDHHWKTHLGAGETRRMRVYMPAIQITSPHQRHAWRSAPWWRWEERAQKRRIVGFPFAIPKHKIDPFWLEKQAKCSRLHLPQDTYHRFPPNLPKRHENKRERTTKGWFSMEIQLWSVIKWQAVWPKGVWGCLES